MSESQESSVLIAPSERRDFYVYAWLRPCGTPFYIGKGTGRRSGNLGSARNRYFTNIVGKIERNGDVPTVVRLYDRLSEEEAFELEKAEIAKHGRIEHGGTLCNMTDGGDGISNPSVETRAKMRAARIGRPLSAETRAKIGAASSKRGQTEETRAKLSVYAKNRSPETRAKLSAASSNRSQETRDKISAWERTAETRAKMSAWERTPELRAKISLVKRNPTDETRANLSASAKNRSPEVISAFLASKLMSPPRSGFKGAYLHKPSGKWVAQISPNGQRRHLGTFKTSEEAARAYDAAAFAEWGAGCYLNFPEDFHTTIQ
ncbi:AP2 domain-containing protein [Rhizobium leguminosarum]